MYSWQDKLCNITTINYPNMFIYFLQKYSNLIIPVKVNVGFDQAICTVLNEPTKPEKNEE